MVTDIITLYLLPDDAPPAMRPLLLQRGRGGGLHRGVCGARQPVSRVAGGGAGGRSEGGYPVCYERNMGLKRYGILGPFPGRRHT